MMVFFQTRLEKTLIWQKFSETEESDFKESMITQLLKTVNKKYLLEILHRVLNLDLFVLVKT